MQGGEDRADRLLSAAAGWRTLRVLRGESNLSNGTATVAVAGRMAVMRGAFDERSINRFATVTLLKP